MFAKAETRCGGGKTGDHWRHFKESYLFECRIYLESSPKLLLSIELVKVILKLLLKESASLKLCRCLTKPAPP